MKHLLIFILKAYKKVVSPALGSVLGLGGGCRFDKTCSEYAVEAISKHGTLKGVYMSLVRLLHCQPFSSRNLKYESI